MTTLAEIAALLDAAQLNYGRTDGRIRTGFGTDVRFFLHVHFPNCFIFGF